jgi:hypothetical protein
MPRHSRYEDSKRMPRVSRHSAIPRKDRKQVTVEWRFGIWQNEKKQQTRKSPRQLCQTTRLRARSLSHRRNP